MPDAAKSIVVVCEAAADQRVACELAERALCNEVNWITPELLDAFRRWRGLTDQNGQDGRKFLTWTEAKSEAERRDVEVFGNFDGKPGDLEASAVRRTLTLVRKYGEGDIDAVLLIRDSDGKTRRRGFEQARTSWNASWPVIIGIPHTKRECWVLAGFEPKTAEEQACLVELRQELGFDPRLRSEELSAAEKGAKKNAKRVLKELAPDYHREAECWQETDLTTLAERGANNGLADYMREVKERLVPLWKPGPRK